MNFFEDLNNVTSDASVLENYLSNNFDRVYDYFELQKHSELLKIKENLRKYIGLNIRELRKLDKKSINNQSFIALLLSVCERLGLASQFKLLYDLLEDSNFNFGSRLKASSLYLVGVDEFVNHLERYEDFYVLLHTAYEEEEDGKDKLIITIINYYSRILIDFGRFNSDAVKQVRDKLLLSASNDENSFLNDNLIKKILGVDLDNFEQAFKHLHNLLDEYLNREIVLPPFTPDFLIEKDTRYIELLVQQEPNFPQIKKLSADLYKDVRSDSVYYSLQRGVGILMDEIQLFAYMYSFGNMHYEKLISAFNVLPLGELENDLNIFDWGCGQAMATMAYFDFLKNKYVQKEPKYSTLIEPSQAALQRAAAHVVRYFPKIQVNTINKSLDFLEKDDFVANIEIANLHLFSNIIDIEHFSLNKLLSLIDNTFTGLNYFICVSPFIDDLKTNRLNVFMHHFSNRPDFEILENIDNRKGEWKNGWTRVVRVFKCRI